MAKFVRLTKFEDGLKMYVNIDTIEFFHLNEKEHHTKNENGNRQTKLVSYSVIKTSSGLYYCFEETPEEIMELIKGVEK